MSIDTRIYRVIQEDRSIFWKVTISAIVRKELHMNMCLIMDGCGDTAVLNLQTRKHCEQQ